VSKPTVVFSRVLAVVLALPATTVWAEPFSVELSVREPRGIARVAEPISGGVPLPEGLFGEDQPFSLVRADGTEIPCQVSPLVVETDGTLRWVLIDFQDDVGERAANRYTLQAGRAKVQPAVRLKIAEDDRNVEVDTGRITMTVSKTAPFGLIRCVTADGKPVIAGGTVSYVQMQGRSGWDDPSKWQAKRFVAGPPDFLKVHYAGALRVTIEVAGRFDGDPLGAGYKAWLTAWAGSSRVGVKYKLCNSNSQQYTAILAGRSAIELELASSANDVLIGAKEPLNAGARGWLHQGLYPHHTYQDIPGAVKAGSGERVLWTGNGPDDRPQGWIAASGACSVFVCDRLFASNPARRLSITDGKLVLEGIAARFEGPKDRKFNVDRRVGEPWKSVGFWLYDCSHHCSEYLFDFAAPAQADELGDLARLADSRLWALAPGETYSRCEVLGSGPFGTLEDEKVAYRKWGWTYSDDRLPRAPQPEPGAFVAGEDNHYESEADSVQGLLLMYLRTGQRGWFDLAEAWARYHMDLQTWRTDGWAWKDGGIWFPTGGPQGNRPVREPWDFQWGPPWGNRQGSPECSDLQRQSQSKSCYCHFYGSGLADYYCLTGDPDALAAAVDNTEQKDDEFRHFQDFRPGESAVGSIRGFGRGFEVIMRVLQADPQNRPIRDLADLCARTLWESPLLDERGFHCSRIGGGFAGMKTELLSPPIRKWMASQGITFTVEGDTVDRLNKGDKSWPVRAMGGTWQHIYIQNGADLYARYFDDEDMRDFVIAFAKFSERYMLSPKCHQTWYYTYFDVPDLGMVFDPWALEHTDTTDGEGCVHSGWYTRFYPDACAKGYSLTGEPSLLDKAREFWYYGSKREYRTKGLRGGPNEVNRFAGHTPPKDDTVLEVSRLFYHGARAREDPQPPAAVSDLQVRLLGDGRAEVTFTAPRDSGGGRVVGYQVKAATLPIVAYEPWNFARDDGVKRNWWRAVNLKGEPSPGSPGAVERFTVTGIPDGRRVYFALRSFDDRGNRSDVSNVTVAAQ
jgi:hypothetical protein